MIGPVDVIELARPDNGDTTAFLASLYAVIGCQSVECVELTTTWDMWLDETGMVNGRAANQRATLLARSYGLQNQLFGDVVVTGANDDTGLPTGLTGDQAEGLARRVSGPDDAPPGLSDAPRLHDVVAAAQSWWDEEMAAAEAFDVSCADRSKAWPPPIMATLVEAASRTDLVRFFPFHSHNVLRFATSPNWYLSEGDVAPAFVVLGRNPDRYLVFSGELRGITTIELETDSPTAAADRAADLLLSWSPTEQDR